MESRDKKGIIVGDWTPVEQGLLERQHEADIEAIKGTLIPPPNGDHYLAGYNLGIVNALAALRPQSEKGK